MAVRNKKKLAVFQFRPDYYVPFVLSLDFSAVVGPSHWLGGGRQSCAAILFHTFLSGRSKLFFTIRDESTWSSKSRNPITVKYFGNCVGWKVVQRNYFYLATLLVDASKAVDISVWRGLRSHQVNINICESFWWRMRFTETWFGMSNYFALLAGHTWPGP